MSHFIEANQDYHSCNCIGPQNGEPKCPCMMKNVRKDSCINRWSQREVDLGPINPTAFDLVSESELSKNISRLSKQATIMHKWKRNGDSAHDAVSAVDKHHMKTYIARFSYESDAEFVMELINAYIDGRIIVK